MDAIAQALKGEFATQVAELIYLTIRKDGLPQKMLLNPAETAWALGFTERAFSESHWKNELPVVKIGIKTFYRAKDLQTFIDNHTIQRLSRRSAA